MKKENKGTAFTTLLTIASILLFLAVFGKSTQGTNTGITENIDTTAIFTAAYHKAENFIQF